MNKQILRNVILSSLFLVPFIPFLVYSGFFFPFITTKAFVWRLIVEVVFAAWILLAYIDPAYRLKKSFILYAVFGFLAIIGLADLLGAAPVKSFWSNFERMEGYVTLLHLGALFVVMSSMLNEINWKRWWNTSLVASALMALVALFQVIGVTDPSQAGTRVDGTFGNTIYLAVYMLFHIFLAGLFLWRGWARAGLRWVYILLILFQIFILYHTATRGAILGLIGGLFIVAILNVRNKEDKLVRKASIALLAGLIIFVTGFWAMRNTEFVMNNPVLSRFATLTTENLKTQGRYFIWPIALEGFKDRPILGWGQENFNLVFQEYYRPDMYHLEPWFDRAHNIFLDWMIAGGALGLIAYLSLYGTLLLLIWKKAGFIYTEKTILTGLIAAYFFHNFFVFDHLMSYVLFFSLLSYVHGRSIEPNLEKKPLQNEGANIALPIVTVGLVAIVYFVNIQPLAGNSKLLTVLATINSPAGSMATAVENFEDAYKSSRLGRIEVVEQMTMNAPNILRSDSLSIEEKNEFFSFVRDAVVGESENYPDDARLQIIAGSFLSTTGYSEEGLAHLEKAREIIPNKQQVYFELGRAYLLDGDNSQALEVFRQAYEMAPSYNEAKIYYLLGSIYAGDRLLESSLIAEVGEQAYIFDDRIAAAYYESGRLAEVRAILMKRIDLDPANESSYRELLNSIGN